MSATPFSHFFAEYASERFPLRRYGFVAVIFAFAALAGDTHAGLVAFSRAAILSLVLLFQLRLWDDLADVDRDRIDDPNRVLSRASGAVLRRARAALVAIGLINAALVAVASQTPLAIVIFLALSAALFIWYRGARRALQNAAFSSLVSLAKYPVVVYLAGTDPERAGVSFNRALAIALVYLTFCAYEILHDPRVCAERGAIVLLGAETLCMIALSVIMGVAAAGQGAIAVAVYIPLSIIASIGLIAVFLLCRRHGAFPRLSQGVFVLCLMQIVSFNAALRA